MHEVEWARYVKPRIWWRTKSDWDHKQNETTKKSFSLAWIDRSTHPHPPALREKEDIQRGTRMCTREREKNTVVMSSCQQWSCRRGAGQVAGRRASQSASPRSAVTGIPTAEPPWHLHPQNQETPHYARSSGEMSQSLDDFRSCWCEWTKIKSEFKKWT